MVKLNECERIVAVIVVCGYISKVSGNNKINNLDIAHPPSIGI